MGSYSKTGYLAIKVEATENTAVKPTTFVPLMSEDIVTQYGPVAATPISASRTVNRRAICKAIEAPSGSINVLIEPKTIGNFLRGVMGAVTTGIKIPISSVTGTFVVGETITGGTSAATATITAVSSENDYLLVGTWTGTFVSAETITGGTSSATATTGSVDSSVNGHEFVAPQSSLPTYTIELGFDNEAYRYTGVRFTSFDPIAQSDNIITAGIGVMARAEFKHGRVTTVTSAGAGSQTITVDQTTGLVAADTIKLFRPSTGQFIDFSAASVKTHTIDSITNETSFVITNLETSTVVGDLIVLAPQTPTYTVDDEFCWIGGSIASVADDITTAIATAGDSIEDFDIALTNDIEGRHGANGTNLINRFPTTNFLKGLTGTMSLTRTYDDMTYLDRLRSDSQTAINVVHTGNQIGSTGINYSLDWRMPNGRFDAFNASLSEDDLLNQEMPLNMYDSSDDGYLFKVVLTNDVASY